jgi:hypothetical protein
MVGPSVALALLIVVPRALAGGMPPKTELRVGGQSQRGGVVWEEWNWRDGQYCVYSSADGTGTYPKPLRVSAGSHRARFLLFRRQMPVAVTITAWHRLDSRGYETGASEVLPYTLRPRRNEQGRVTAWGVRFSVKPPPDYYLHLYARWPDGRCGGPRHLLRTYSIATR